jgi:hypothetical protein
MDRVRRAVGIPTALKMFYSIGVYMNRRKTSGTSTATKKRRLVEPADEVIIERTRTLWEPVVEIRKPATLAQALTEPVTAVVKPNTKTIVMRTISRRA